MCTCLGLRALRCRRMSSCALLIRRGRPISLLALFRSMPNSWHLLPASASTVVRLRGTIPTPMQSTHFTTCSWVLSFATSMLWHTWLTLVLSRMSKLMYLSSLCWSPAQVKLWALVSTFVRSVLSLSGNTPTSLLALWTMRTSILYVSSTSGL